MTADDLGVWLHTLFDEQAARHQKSLDRRWCKSLVQSAGRALSGVLNDLHSPRLQLKTDGTMETREDQLEALDQEPRLTQVSRHRNLSRKVAIEVLATWRQTTTAMKRGLRSAGAPRQLTEA